MPKHTFLVAAEGTPIFNRRAMLGSITAAIVSIPVAADALPLTSEKTVHMTEEQFENIVQIAFSMGELSVTDRQAALDVLERERSRRQSGRQL